MHSDWETNFFQGIALEAWRRCVTPEITRAEADFLERNLAIRPGASLLDVPCGNGRHAIEFARRGYRVTGVDSSAAFLEEARRSAAAARWIGGDMRCLGFEAEFDGAWCFGNSFGYLDAEEAAQFLAGIAGSLHPRARFAVDTGMTAESILPTLARNRWYRFGDLLMLSRNWYHAAESRLEIEYTFVRGSEHETRLSSSYVFTAADLCRMHTQAGLEPVHLFSSLQGDAYELGSPRLLLVSERRSA
jgi:SAM-dependent methyltransferase